MSLFIPLYFFHLLFYHLALPTSSFDFLPFSLLFPSYMLLFTLFMIPFCSFLFSLSLHLIFPSVPSFSVPLIFLSFSLRNPYHFSCKPTTSSPPLPKTPTAVITFPPSSSASLSSPDLYKSYHLVSTNHILSFDNSCL